MNKLDSIPGSENMTLPNFYTPNIFYIHGKEYLSPA